MPSHVPKSGQTIQGKFDDGWDAYRERTLILQKELGIVLKKQLYRHDRMSALD